MNKKWISIFVYPLCLILILRCRFSPDSIWGIRILMRFFWDTGILVF